MIGHQLTRNFHLKELACKDGTAVPREYHDEALKICARVQVLRDLVGPLHVNSAYRTPEYNASVGGARGSLHLSCSALDLTSKLWTPEQLLTLWDGLVRLGLAEDGGVGVYPEKNFIHIDLGPRRRWRG